MGWKLLSGDGVPEEDEDVVREGCSEVQIGLQIRCCGFGYGHLHRTYVAKVLAWLV